MLLFTTFCLNLVFELIMPDEYKSVSRDFTSILGFNVYPANIFNHFSMVMAEVLNHLHQIEFLHDPKGSFIT